MIYPSQDCNEISSKRCVTKLVYDYPKNSCGITGDTLPSAISSNALPTGLAE